MENVINGGADNLSNYTATPADHTKTKFECCGENVFIPVAFGFAGLTISATLCYFVFDVPVTSPESAMFVGGSSLSLSLIGCLCVEFCCCNCNKSNKNNREEDLDPAMLPPQSGR